MMSLVEAAANVVVGFGLALITQAALFAFLGLQINLAENLLIVTAFTIVSLLRSFALRRIFEAIRERSTVSNDQLSARE